jgi:hypothetical protein
MSSGMSRLSLDKQNGVRVVQITAVDTNVPAYPLAIGVDYTGGEFEINLSYLPLGLQNLPNVNEVWHIENRYGRFWTLMGRQTEDARGLAPGDPVGSSFAYKVGDTGPGGGIIFFVDRFNEYTGFTYLEVAPVSTQVQRTWATDTDPGPGIGNQQTGVSGADSRALGAGYQNTLDIVAQTGNVAATCAAKYCDDLVSGGQSDWYLPSISELQLVRNVVYNQLGVGGFLNSSYWSSTENTASNAWYYTFHTELLDTLSKTQNQYVRPVRRF